MKLSWTIQEFNSEGTQEDINVETLILNPGQQFEAGFARIANEDGQANLKVVEQHTGIKVSVGKNQFPVTLLNGLEHAQIGEQPFLQSDVLQVFVPATSGSTLVTTLALLPDDIPATVAL